MALRPPSLRHDSPTPPTAGRVFFILPVSAEQEEPPHKLCNAWVYVLQADSELYRLVAHTKEFLLYKRLLIGRPRVPPSLYLHSRFLGHSPYYPSQTYPPSRPSSIAADTFGHNQTTTNSIPQLLCSRQPLIRGSRWSCRGIVAFRAPETNAGSLHTIPAGCDVQLNYMGSRLSERARTCPPLHGVLFPRHTRTVEHYHRSRRHVERTN
jgi:hypothetical protein